LLYVISRIVGLASSGRFDSRLSFFVKYNEKFGFGLSYLFYPNMETEAQHTNL